jgi:hypothetical protein
LFPPSQQLGHLPEGLCTPEVREQCRQFVYANAVKKGARNMRVKEFHLRLCEHSDFGSEESGISNAGSNNQGVCFKDERASQRYFIFPQ